MSDISKLNRKIKSGMKVFIKNEGPGALQSVIKLAQERQILLKARPMKETENE